jgi:hypothetical protein
MQSGRTIEWEGKLKRVFDEIDAGLEQRYAGRFNLQPNRSSKGTTSNPEMDGLFNVGASYSAGFGSQFGPGYVVEIRLSTLQRIPRELKQELREQVKVLLMEKLPAAFPGKTLRVDTEQGHLRIHGDLSLD